MIKNVVFDIGNVLSDFCWREFLKDKGFDEEMIERIGHASVLTDSWYEFDKGVLPDNDVIELFVKNDPGIAKELHEAFDEVRGMVRLKDATFDWIRGLKKRGYRVYYLSNYSHKAETQCPEATSFIPEMDGGILSYTVKMTKPDPAIYALLLKRYGLEPTETVFIDDTEKNVVAAREQGIHGIVYRDGKQAAEDLEKLLANRITSERDANGYKL